MSPTPPPLLEHTRVHMCGDTQHAHLSSAPRELQPSWLLWPCPACPGWLGTGFHCPGGGYLPALVWPSTTFPHFWVAGLGWGGESQWTLMPWNWNSGQPRLPQVLISRGWPKGLGQEGREDFRGQYHPHTEEEEVFKVKPTGGWVNKLFVCPRTPAPLPLSLVPLSSLCVCVAPGMFLCLSLCSLSPFISSSWLGILERTSGRPEFKSLYHFLAV